MNKEALLAVADVIEYMNRFDMDVVASGDDGELDDATVIWEDCGTVGCIAGWTLAWADIHAHAKWLWGENEASWMKAARKELGLTKRQAEELFFPDSEFWKKTVSTTAQKDRWSSWDDVNPITVEDAVGVLRGLAAGTVKL